MMTVHEVSKLTGLSVRTLQYYDKIGLLPPKNRTAAGYRLYDEASLERLQQIMLFRTLEFPLKEIREIVNAPDFDRKLALEQQITMLEIKKEQLEALILFARGIKALGVKNMNNMDFSAFDKSKLAEYAKRAKEQWGHTPEYREMQEKEAARTPAEQERLTQDLMRLFTEFGGLRDQAPGSDAVQHQVQRLQDFITAHLYHCTDQILAGLGKMYAGGGEISENIERAGGEGTAAFTAKAIEIFCATGNSV